MSSWPVSICHILLPLLVTNVLHVAQSLIYLPRQHMPHSLRRRIANWVLHHLDMVDMLTMIVRLIQQALQALQADLLVPVDVISTTLFALNAVKVSLRSGYLYCSLIISIVFVDGHYANHCPNRNVPGNRGGMDRTTQRKFEDE